MGQTNSRALISACLAGVALAVVGCSGARHNPIAGSRSSGVCQNNGGFFHNFIGTPGPVLGPAGHIQAPGRIPDVIGVQVQQGYALLHRDGLRVTVPRAFALCAPHHEVASIDEVTPRAGERYRTGSAITVTVAPHVVSRATTSRHIVTYAVPGFIGRPLSAATRWIEHKNLDLAENYGPLRSANAATFYENYRVVRQSPAAGTALRLGITTKTGDFVTTPLVLWLAQVR